jgi:pilus assembly protein Flp/PilA
LAAAIEVTLNDLVTTRDKQTKYLERPDGSILSDTLAAAVTRSAPQTTATRGHRKQRKINLEFYRLNYQFSAEINFLNLAFHLDRMVHTEKINMKVLTQLLADDSGVTAIEYSLIAALIAVAAIGSFTLIGSSLSTTFSTVAGKL